jgi:hypothetical protein
MKIFPKELTVKQREFIKLRDDWIEIRDLDFLRFISDSIPDRTIPAEKYTCYNPNKKIGIVSLYTPEISEHAIESELSVRRYAEMRGYTFHVYRDSIDKESHPNWSKPQAILNHIRDHEVIIWMDSDTLIFNTHIRFEDILSKCRPPQKIIATRDIGGKSMINTGIVMFRNHQYTVNLIEKWANFTCDKSSLYSSGGDQEVLCEILKKSDPQGFNRKIFPMSEFNTDPRFVQEDTFILHLMAYGPILKNIFMKYWNS